MQYLSPKEIQDILIKTMNKFHSFCVSHSIPYYMIGGTMLGAYRHKGFIPWDDDMDVGMTRENYERFLDLANQTEELKVHNYKNSKNISYCLTRIYMDDYAIDSLLDPKLDPYLYFDIFVLDNVPDDVTLQRKQASKIAKIKKLIRLKSRYKDSRGVFSKLFKYLAHFLLLPVKYNWLVSKVDKTMSKYSSGVFSEYICSMNSQYSYSKQCIKRSVFGTPTLYKFEDYEFFGVEKPEEYLSHLFGKDYMQLPPIEKRRTTANVYKIEKE